MGIIENKQCTFKSTSPKSSVPQITAYLKNNNAVIIFEKHVNLK